MGHNSGDSSAVVGAPPAGSGVNKRHRVSPRNPAKNPAGQLRSNSAETTVYAKPRLVSCCFTLYFYQKVHHLI